MQSMVKRRLLVTACATGLVGVATQLQASGFQLWEQDGASIGNYHAGYAAAAMDASTAFYNPAGIVRFNRQQVVIGADAVLTDFKYKGSVALSEGDTEPFIATTTYNSVVAQGGTFNIVPDLHYVAPITDRVGFGFSVDVPFGLKTNYGTSSPLRYASTYTSINVIDISPSLGIRVTDKSSVGIGFDVQRAFAEFDSVGTTVGVPGTDSTSTNRANDTGYGYHAGALYEWNEATRAGISYHSQVVHHLTGTSSLIGPVADAVNDGPINSNNARANLTLPPYTAASIYHKVTPNWALMGSAIYTQWSIFKTLTLSGLAAVVNAPYPILVASTSEAQVMIPENYRNTWNLTVGTDYYATDKIILRAGVGYDQTPIQNRYRNAQLPDNNRYVIALGGHYQATKTLGLDLGWTHLFFNQARVAPPAQAMGAQVVTLNGNVNGGADVIGGQITWDFA